MDFIASMAGDGHFRSFTPVNRAPESRHSTVIGGRSPCSGRHEATSEGRFINALILNFKQTHALRVSDERKHSVI